MKSSYICGTINLGLGPTQKIHAKYNVYNPIRHYVQGCCGLIALDAKGDSDFLIHFYCTTIREGYFQVRGARPDSVWDFSCDALGDKRMGSPSVNEDIYSGTISLHSASILRHGGICWASDLTDGPIRYHRLSCLGWRRRCTLLFVGRRSLVRLLPLTKRPHIVQLRL